MVGPAFSRLSFGAWAAGGVGWGEVDDRESIASLQKAVDLGMTVVDTAPIYGFGHSEVVVGRALKGIRDRVLLVTKAGLVWDSERQVRTDDSRATLLREVEDSLRRLDVDVIDLYLVHWPDGKTPVEEILATLQEIRDSGKIRWFGLSNFGADDLRKAADLGGVHAVQLGYNLLQREAEQDVLPLCREQGWPVMAYSPLAQGLLTGRFRRDLALPEGDVRRNNPLFAPDRYSRSLDVVDRLRSLASERGRTLLELAVGWVLRQEPLATAICGARTPEQVEGVARAMEARLDDAEIAAIQSAWQDSFGPAAAAMP